MTGGGVSSDANRKAGPAGRHVGLADQLGAEIRSSAYPVGSRFPTELELQQRFDVGRHTVREALKILTEQGLLGRRRKTGTVVLSQTPVSPYVHSLRDIKGLFDFANSTVLDIRHEGFASLPAGSLREFAGIEDKRWFRIAGLRSTRHDLAPLCWSEVMVPERFAPDKAAVRQGDRAVYQVVLDQFGLKLEYVEQNVTATRLPSQLAKVLNAETDGPALLVKRRYVAHTGATFEISHNLYPADRYSIHSVIRQRA
ncbi:MAG: GntR family transcriptional regulator [Enterovirga sp.]|jgi:GntR family transcriptional regulator|nr:GntR family transcriptional regulator [Enterovirga sp.]